MYLFTPRNRKYRNGSRPSRAADGGYWKATGKDKPVKYRGTLVGYRKTLDFYTGKALQGENNNWKMHEFTVNDPAPNHQLDDWVLCKIYKKIKKPNDVRNRQRDEESSALTAIDDVNSVYHHGEDRTDLPVMDSGHAGEIDMLVPVLFLPMTIANKRSLQVNSLLILTSLLLHIAACFPVWPRLVEILPKYFANSDNLSAQDELLNPACILSLEHR
ncbi:hypothetical protein OIU77_027325 [Salix suchowensis]|uniref:NAC domain-containing protein n=1 Tax=Salix suchowensis TaxID=1278906 RepID=A0ABQ9BRR6_9ROSI|nr:hypothetical protein OIU77_027325 [Salix suchowensis]